MTPNQLGNVLIKILGLYLCVQSIEHITASLQNVIQLLGEHTRTPRILRMGWYLATYLISLAIGVYLIARSQRIANRFFKDQ